MKIKVIKTYDSGAFEKSLEELYRTVQVKDVQTHTESESIGGRFIIYYVGIVFYQELYKDGTIEELNLRRGIYYTLKRNDIDTIEELRYAMETGKVRMFRNIGPVALKEIEEKLERL